MRRKTTEAKQFMGTHKPSRDPKPSTMDVLQSTPRPPAYLSPAATQEWRRVAPEAVRVGVTQADLRALALLCEALATESKLREVIETEGTTIQAGSGGQKAHPALAALASARHQSHQLMADFGLLPRSRISMPVKPGIKGPNRFDRIGRNPFDEFKRGAK